MNIIQWTPLKIYPIIMKIFLGHNLTRHFFCQEDTASKEMPHAYSLFSELLGTTKKGGHL
jgi:hypothetical protein